jgi:hypothetical protein
VLVRAHQLVAISRERQEDLELHLGLLAWVEDICTYPVGVVVGKIALRMSCCAPEFQR